MEVCLCTVWSTSAKPDAGDLTQPVCVEIIGKAFQPDPATQCLTAEQLGVSGSLVESCSDGYRTNGGINVTANMNPGFTQPPTNVLILWYKCCPV